MIEAFCKGFFASACTTVDSHSFFSLASVWEVLDLSMEVLNAVFNISATFIGFYRKRHQTNEDEGEKTQSNRKHRQTPFFNEVHFLKL